MAQYKVTITPAAAGGGDANAASHTAMRVIAENGQAYLTELTVRVADDAKLGPREAIQVDLDVLLQAFARPQQAAYADPSPGPAPSGSAAIEPASRRDRAYRRMPDPAEVRQAYLASRTISGVAEHFEVPLHTAQGWVSRLRRKGILPKRR